MKDQLSATFSALADPTRRAVLVRLTQGEATVTQLAESFPLTMQAVSKHLAVLERAGLVERRRSAQLRPARLRPIHLREATEWLQSYAFWDASFDTLEKRLNGGTTDD
jgi:DNA-binding transcriptional ArsR family regulator